MGTPDKRKCDFSGYGTRYNVLCSDGRTIRNEAFDWQDGQVIPLVWSHDHKTLGNVLGHALLEKRKDGMYAYGYFNDTPNGIQAKTLVEHGDITKLSINATGLKQKRTSAMTADVMHGEIKELSLVLAGANEGAYIDFHTMSHSDYDDEDAGDATIYAGNDSLIHIGFNEEDAPEGELSHEDNTKKEETEVADENKKDLTVAEVYNGMTEDQKFACAFIAQQMVEEATAANHSDDDGETFENEEGENVMKHNAFDTSANINNTGLNSDQLQHAMEFKEAVIDLFKDTNRLRQITSLRDTLMHADDDPAYGITNIGYLFPDYKNLYDEPEFIKRETGWVYTFLNATRKTPFSRIKSLWADITEDAARAKGYIKATQKWPEVFPIFNRTTDPQTIYKLQKFDRDDLIDVTSLNVVAWVKKEMRLMLDEERARAALVGDGRQPDAQFKIQESHIRPIYTDDDIFAHHVRITHKANASAAKKAEMFIESAIRNRKHFKGTSGPTLFITTDFLVEMLLLKDGVGRDLYETRDKLATKLGVSKIEEVDVMEGIERTVTDEDHSTHDLTLAAIIVNPVDYTFGADKGGEINMFDDFDINFNQYEYLMEVRCSGALVKPKSALVFEYEEEAQG